jgi:hypothetical protein
MLFTLVDMFHDLDLFQTILRFGLSIVAPAGPVWVLIRPNAVFVVLFTDKRNLTTGYGGVASSVIRPVTE